MKRRIRRRTAQGRHEAEGRKNRRAVQNQGGCIQGVSAGCVAERQGVGQETDSDQHVLQRDVYVTKEE